MRFVSYCAALAAAASFAPGAKADDVVRCGSGRLVNVGMIAAEIIARCGEPESRTVEEIPVHVRTRTGNVVQSGTTRIETWIYDRGAGQFVAELKFEEDKLVRIELRPQR